MDAFIFYSTFMKLLSSWSGGKDSCFALQIALQNQNYTLAAVLNVMNENNLISRSHAIPKHILELQANALGVKLVTVASTWNDYEEKYIATLHSIKKQFEVDTVVFGDIDIQQHRDWEEKVCKAADLKPILPLWQLQRKQLVYAMIDAGIEATIVSCNTKMGINFLGQKISKKTITALEQLGVDACGENGEFHTLVTNCSLFASPINVTFGEKVIVNDYCFIKMK